MLVPRMASDSTNRDVLPLKSAWVTDFGNSVTIGWKATAHQCLSTVTWELRLLLQDFYQGGAARWSVKYFLKENEKPLIDKFSEFGESWSDHYSPSRESFFFRNGRDATPGPLVRQEAQLKTGGVILWLLDFATSRHRRAEQSHAKAMLCSFFSSTLSLEFDWREKIGSVIDNEVHNCAEGRARPDSWCLHLEEDMSDTLKGSWLNMHIKYIIIYVFLKSIYFKK